MVSDSQSLAGSFGHVSHFYSALVLDISQKLYILIKTCQANSCRLSKVHCWSRFIVREVSILKRRRKLVSSTSFLFSFYRKRETTKQCGCVPTKEATVGRLAFSEERGAVGECSSASGTTGLRTSCEQDYQLGWQFNSILCEQFTNIENTSSHILWTSLLEDHSV